MVHVPAAECPEGREGARWVIRVAPAGTDPVVTQAVATHCTLPFITTALGIWEVACAMFFPAGVRNRYRDEIYACMRRASTKRAIAP